MHLIKLLVIILISMLIGTLPYIDNWSHIGGLIFGVVSGIVFLPYITFGKWDATRKKILLYICVPLLLLLMVMAILVFYRLTNTSFCAVINRTKSDGTFEEVDVCGLFNCIRWHESIDCDAFY